MSQEQQKRQQELEEPYEHFLVRRIAKEKEEIEKLKRGEVSDTIKEIEDSIKSKEKELRDIRSGEKDRQIEISVKKSLIKRFEEMGLTEYANIFRQQCKRLTDKSAVVVG